MTFSKNHAPEDPRLTAYALGELDPADRAEIERLLQEDPVARAAVEEIRHAAAALHDVLARETPPEGDTLDLRRILAGARLAEPEADVAEGSALNGHAQAPAPATPRRKRNPFVPFPYVFVATAAAAALAILIVVETARHADRRAPASAQAVERAKGPPETEGLTEIRLEPLKRALPQARTSAGANAAVDPSAPAAAVAAAPIAADKAMSDFLSEEESVELPSFVPSSSRHQDQPAAVSPSGRGHELALHAPPGGDAESYAVRVDNAFRRASEHPLSTFSVDVDTASYANVRRMVTAGELPPADAVRIEELINFFSYSDAPPSATSAAPLAAALEVASAPWAPEHRLVRIGLKGREVAAERRPPANLVFLIDVSGSMDAPNKLPLVQRSLRLLLDQLQPDDRVALVVYAGASGLALPSTPVSKKAEIVAALQALSPEGSTNGALGLHLAYDIAKANFLKGGVNRVLLATDGDFNVGVTDRDELTRLIEEKARSGVFLTVLGFGMGNLKDATLEQLADKGNGQYGYIDTLAEARRLLVEQVGGTLVTLAKDVKLQVEFNPARVAAYRLIGYENRLLADEAFADDRVDAGEIGAGHTVTALYEIVPAGKTLPEGGTGFVEPLKYADAAGKEPSAPSRAAASAELLTVKVRYKEPAADVSQRLEFPLVDGGADFAGASADFKFAAAVAGWGMLLRDSPHRGAATFERVLGWAESGLGRDPQGQRGEFLNLVRRSRDLAASRGG